MATPARGDCTWNILTALAIVALGCVAARDLLQINILELLESLGPFEAAEPTDCADLCTQQEGCKGYRWRGGMCNLTVLPDNGVPEPPPSMEVPVSEPEVDPVLAPATAPTSGAMSPDIDVIAPPPPKTNDTNSTLMTTEEIIAFIENCRNTGSLAAGAAASASCLVVTNNCPVPSEDPRDNVAPLNLAADEPPLPAVEQLRAALDEACRRETIETCKREAFKSAEILNPDCVRILNRGPDVSVVGCEDVRVANQMFANETAKICEA